ncbi:MAG TPA: hypothetical protein VJC03_09210, partial [bacterium]|nr:hypothetical protein [bacterium]
QETVLEKERETGKFKNDIEALKREHQITVSGLAETSKRKEEDMKETLKKKEEALKESETQIHILESARIELETGQDKLISERSALIEKKEEELKLLLSQKDQVEKNLQARIQELLLQLEAEKNRGEKLRWQEAEIGQMKENLLKKRTELEQEKGIWETQILRLREELLQEKADWDARLARKEEEIKATRQAQEELARDLKRVGELTDQYKEQLLRLQSDNKNLSLELASGKNEIENTAALFKEKEKNWEEKILLKSEEIRGMKQDMESRLREHEAELNMRLDHMESERKRLSREIDNLIREKDQERLLFRDEQKNLKREISEIENEAGMQNENLREKLSLSEETRRELIKELDIKEKEISDLITVLKKKKGLFSRIFG